MATIRIIAAIIDVFCIVTLGLMVGKIIRDLKNHDDGKSGLRNQ
jgi:hypothetical protein